MGRPLDTGGISVSLAVHPGHRADGDIVIVVHQGATARDLQDGHPADTVSR